MNCTGQMPVAAMESNSWWSLVTSAAFSRSAKANAKQSARETRRNVAFSRPADSQRG